MCQAQLRIGFHLHLIIRIPPHSAAHATYALRVIGPVSEDQLQGSFASTVGLFCLYSRALLLLYHGCRSDASRSSSPPWVAVDQ
jgi:hypothetical protein